MSAFVRGAAPPRSHYNFSGRSAVLDLAGMPVATDTEVWTLNEPTTRITLNWSSFPVQNADTFQASVSYIAELIKRFSPTKVTNNFKAFRLLAQSPAFLEADRSGNVIPYKAISEVHAWLGLDGWQAHYLRNGMLGAATRASISFRPRSLSSSRK